MILKAGEKLKSGRRGRLKLSLIHTTAPENAFHLLATVIDANGGRLNIPVTEIFDNVIGTQDVGTERFQEFLTRLHDEDLKKREKSEKRRTDELLKSEIDKLSRWLIDEKQAIHLKGDKMKNKIISLKRHFKMEKNFEKKLALDEEIRRMQKEMDNTDFNTFDIEQDLDKKFSRLSAAKKRTMKTESTTETIFDVSWSVA